MTTDAWSFYARKALFLSRIESSRMAADETIGLI